MGLLGIFKRKSEAEENTAVKKTELPDQKKSPGGICSLKMYATENWLNCQTFRKKQSCAFGMVRK